MSEVIVSHATRPIPLLLKEGSLRAVRAGGVVTVFCLDLSHPLDMIRSKNSVS